jgi:hypothetical protein
VQQYYKFYVSEERASSIFKETQLLQLNASASSKYKQPSKPDGLFQINAVHIATLCEHFASVSCGFVVCNVQNFS